MAQAWFASVLFRETDVGFLCYAAHLWACHNTHYFRDGSRKHWTDNTQANTSDRRLEFSSITCFGTRSVQKKESLIS